MSENAGNSTQSDEQPASDSDDDYTLTDAQPVDPSGNSPAGALSRSDRLVKVVLDLGVKLYKEQDGSAYAEFPVGDHLERYRLCDRGAARLLRLFYGKAHRRTVGGKTVPSVPSTSALNEALNQIEAIAGEQGELIEPRVRCCKVENAVFIDRGGPDWQVILVDEQGWAILHKASVPLLRPAGIRPLPVPHADPDAVPKFRALLNVKQDQDFMLIVAWLVAALYPDGPYCILAIDGEAGSAKTTACRLLRRLVDPNSADLRSPPKSAEDVILAASNARVVAFENMSSMNEELADLLCRVATGAAFGTRKKYTNNGEFLVSFNAPVLINGIPQLMVRSDIADRAIAISLLRIPEDQYKPEAEIEEAFAEAAPGVFAALLDGLSMAVREMTKLKLPRTPRMATFAKIACAAAPAFGWTAGQMLEAFEANREAAIDAVIEDSPLATGVLRFMRGRDEWRGRSTLLLKALNELVDPDEKRHGDWPRTGSGLAARGGRLCSGR